MNIRLADTISRSNNQVATEIDGEVVMMSVQQGKYYGLDEIGTHIWSLLEEPIKVSDVLKKLLSKYDDSANTCENDLLDLLTDMHREALIKIND